MRARALAEYFEDQSRAVDDLCLPPPFKVPLLDRAQRPINDNEPDTVVPDQRAKALDHAAAEKSSGLRARDSRDLGADHIEAYCLGEPDRLFQPGFEGAGGGLKFISPERRLGRRINDQSAARRGPVYC
jgi:hypothetical protein